MFRLEILDKDEKVLTSHKIDEGLTLIGKSPNANVHLSGKNIGPLQLGIKLGIKKAQPELILMDLGGPSPMKVDGKEKVETLFATDSSVIEIGGRKLRVIRVKNTLPDVKKQKWIPIVDENKKTSSQPFIIRIRVYQNGQIVDVQNLKDSFTLNASTYGLEKDHKLVWNSGKKFFLEIPTEWIQKGGRISAGSQIQKLDDYNKAVEIEPNTIYRIQSGIHTLEVMVSQGKMSIGPGTMNPFPKELRKPFGISGLIILGLFSLWTMLNNKKEAPVEEPYKVYARIQNVPIEKILEPEAHDQPQGGGGSGSQSAQSTAPQNGASPSKLAQSLTGGLTSLVGSMLGQVKNNAVVAENGISSAATAAASVANTGTKVGALSNVGTDKNAIAGAAKLGNLGIAGSGKGFSGGSGTGLGTGIGSGIGSGVGSGIGKGSFKLIEEESIVDGGLDKSVIAAVIQNNLAQIKYCYERQLVAEPDLFGKVVVNWDINAQGAVETTNIKQSTMNSAPVEQCMMSKISGWKFPMPKNGTKVHVSYPFLFKSTK